MKKMLLKKMLVLVVLLVLLSVGVSAECYDSDGGVAPYQRGFVSTSSGFYYDSCLTNHSIHEFSCRDGVLDWQVLSCKISCKDVRVLSITELYPPYRYWYLSSPMGQCTGTAGGSTDHSSTGGGVSFVFPPKPNENGSVLPPPVEPPIIPPNETQPPGNTTNGTEPPEPVPIWCNNDNQCGSQDYCHEHECVRVYCPYGHISNHKCVGCQGACVSSCQREHHSKNYCEHLCKETCDND